MGANDNTTRLTGWCILRMSGGKTMPVFRSLADAGFDVWTPVESQSRRLPRSKEKRTISFPVMPTYVFARAHQIEDMIAISQSSLSEHPQFSVFRYLDRYPVISDASLEPLRIAERKGQPPELRPVFSEGDDVCVTDGPASGMSGVVKSAQGNYAVVCFPGGNLPLKIATFVLLHKRIEDVQPHSGAAALAA